MGAIYSAYSMVPKPYSATYWHSKHSSAASMLGVDQRASWSSQTRVKETAIKTKAGSMVRRCRILSQRSQHRAKI